MTDAGRVTSLLLLCPCCASVVPQSGSLELSTDSLLYLVSSMRDRGTSVTVYPEGMILRNPRTWKPPMGASCTLRKGVLPVWLRGVAFWLGQWWHESFDG